jgi:hypothetical protein
MTTGIVSGTIMTRSAQPLRLRHPGDALRPWSGRKIATPANDNGRPAACAPSMLGDTAPAPLIAQGSPA